MSSDDTSGNTSPTPLSPEQQLISLDEQARQELMARARDLNTRLPDGMQRGMALNMAEYVLAAGLPNRNAVAIGCGNFPEAVPWAVLAGGRVHGIDIADDLSVDYYLDRDTVLLAKGHVDRASVTYALGSASGDARDISSYNLQGARYGAAIVKHPNVTNLDPHIYADINRTLIDQGLEAGAVTFITTYAEVERRMYDELLRPYFELGVLSPGITTADNVHLLEPGGKAASHDRGDMGFDFQIYGFRKMRDMTSDERNQMQEQVSVMLDDPASAFNVMMDDVRRSREGS